MGRDILLNGEPHTVIGVLEKGGPFDRAAAQVWKPLAFQPSVMSRDFRWLGASAKLKPACRSNALGPRWTSSRDGSRPRIRDRTRTGAWPSIVSPTC